MKEEEKEDTSSRRGKRSLLYNHPERSDREAGMQEIIDLTGGLKLSRAEVIIEALFGGMFGHIVLFSNFLVYFFLMGNQSNFR